MNSNTTHPLASFFQKIPLFASLDGVELNDVLRGIKPMQLAEKSILFEEGDPSDGAYVIQSGCVEVIAQSEDNQPISVATLGPGEVIGELSLLDGAPRNATIVASVPCQLLKFEKTEFDYLRRNFRPAVFTLTRTIAQVVCSRLRETNDQITYILGGPLSEVATQTSGHDENHHGFLKRLLIWSKS